MSVKNLYLGRDETICNHDYGRIEKDPATVDTTLQYSMLRFTVRPLLDFDPKCLHYVDRPQGTRTGPDRCTDKGALTRIATFSDKSTPIAPGYAGCTGVWVWSTKYRRYFCDSPADRAFVLESI